LFAGYQLPGNVGLYRVVDGRLTQFPPELICGTIVPVQGSVVVPDGFTSKFTKSSIGQAPVIVPPAKQNTVPIPKALLYLKARALLTIANTAKADRHIFKFFMAKGFLISIN